MSNFLDRIKHMKCDRCGVTIGLYTHESGWRCPECIWNERKKLIAAARLVCDKSDLDTTEGYTTIVDLFVFDLENVIDEIERA